MDRRKREGGRKGRRKRKGGKGGRENQEGGKADRKRERKRERQTDGGEVIMNCPSLPERFLTTS